MARAQNAGVKMILVGTQMTTSHEGITLAEKYPEDAWATVAIHPNHFVPEEFWYHDKGEQDHPLPEKLDSVRLKELATHSKVVAIGECGLDYFRLKGTEEEIQKTKELQKAGFREHIRVAREVGKPIMIHCRDAFEDVIEILKNEGKDLRPGVVHFFTGKIEDAEELLELGYSFTFGGVITFTRDYDEVIQSIPIDRILSETDAPYVAPAPYRGKRNEPAYVVETVKKLAELKDVDVEEMREEIWKNACRIFSL